LWLCNRHTKVPAEFAVYESNREFTRIYRTTIDKSQLGGEPGVFS